MPSPLKRYRYENLATQANIAACVQGILEWWKTLKEKSKPRFEASIIAEELALNCLTHGNVQKTPLRFSFEMQAIPGGLNFIYEDNAGGFNPLIKNTCVIESNLEKAPPGGWGIRLVLDHAQNLSYERTAQNLNRIKGTILYE